MKRENVLLLLAVVLAMLPAVPALAGGARDASEADSGETESQNRRSDELIDERNRLVDRSVVDAGIEDPAVVEAMRSVPRHEFVPAEHQGAAYQDRPLPIGEGQTISQPYVVAYMTEQLALTPESTALEVGTGSGYQAAVLAEIASSVHTVEIIEPLAETARRRLDRLGYDNITVHLGDGYFGWEAGAPYDAVIVTAAAGHIPPPLLDQLKPGGRMVIPVGPVHAVQQLILVEKDAGGEISTRQLLPVRFVPMTGQVQE